MNFNYKNIQDILDKLTYRELCILCLSYQIKFDPIALSLLIDRLDKEKNKLEGIIKGTYSSS